MPDGEPFYIYTSVSPRLGRDDLDYQRSCIASWRAAGFNVATVNGHSETERISAFGLDLEIIAAGQGGKPAVADILACIRDKPARHAGIINADCLLLPYPELSRHLASGLDGVVAVVERVDVDDRFVPQSDTCSGFDAFFFDTRAVPARIDDDFRIGVPWWDYCFPMAAVRGGARIVNIDTPLITHRTHRPQWNDESLLQVGQRFWQFLRDWHSSSRESFPVLGPSFDELLVEEALTREQLGIVSLACFRWLQGHRSSNPQQFLNQDMLPIEMLLRSMRVALNEKAEEIGAKSDEIDRRAGEFSKELFHLKDASERMKAELEARLLVLDHEKASLTHYLGEARKHIDDIHASLSWRVTKPLREVSRLARRTRGGRGGMGG
jgi:hypothetical protein